jgi:RecG-like helicase
MSTFEFTDAATWGGRPVAYKIADAIPRGRVVVSGTVRSAQVVDRYGTRSYVCLLDDGTGEIGLFFLGQRRVAGMVVGTRCTVEGTARMADRRLMIWNPFYRIEPGND